MGEPSVWVMRPTSDQVLNHEGMSLSAVPLTSWMIWSLLKAATDGAVV